MGINKITLAYYIAMGCCALLDLALIGYAGYVFWSYYTAQIVFPSLLGKLAVGGIALNGVAFLTTVAFFLIKKFR